ncbi:MAG: hypothetical protein K6F27_08520 [Ruminococcus sp.]|nr:hypothetical protein [Ruminococcus sp.]
MNSNDIISSPFINEIYKERAIKILEQLRGLTVSDATDLLFDLQRAIKTTVDQQIMD